jgi:hypothetical protein
MLVSIYATGIESMRLERDLQAYVKKECQRLNILCYKLEATSHRGMPDLLLLRQGRAAFVEVKSPTGRGRLTMLQARMHKRLREAGFGVTVVDSVEKANLVLREFYEGIPT